MPRRPRFDLVFAPETVAHLGAIDRKYHRLIRKAIEEQLRHMPERITRNRKPLDQVASSTRLGATWELRLGPGNRFRVFYDVNLGERVVYVLAIGVKERNLFIGGEEFEP
ncbi:MAG: type II toxin-antitoxin system RelE/ParE family toxin [Acidobacteria bacterium]|nr:type II toxin-antitoxin system RelE/ParE family toxin [Acidobacteriota bacterium]